MIKTNNEIREMAKQNNVKLWQIAEKMHYTDSHFSRLLRKKFSNEKKQQIIQIINDLAGASSH